MFVSMLFSASFPTVMCYSMFVIKSLSNLPSPRLISSLRSSVKQSKNKWTLLLLTPDPQLILAD